MRDLSQLKDLLSAKTECIWIQTIEEQAFLDDFLSLLVDNPKFQTYNVKEWSNTMGVVDVDLVSGPNYENIDSGLKEIPVLFEKGIIPSCFDEKKMNEKNIWILKDLTPMFSNPKTARYIRDVKEGRKTFSYSPIIVLSPEPVEASVAHLFKVVEYGLPTTNEIYNYLASVPSKTLIKIKSQSPEFRKDEVVVPSDKDLEKLSVACSGLTIKDIAQLAKESIVKFKSLNFEFISQSKIDIVKKSGVLDYKVPSYKMKDIGGSEVLKEWLVEQQIAMSPEARKAGVDMPKGSLFLGVPGNGKTALAEAFAGELGIPLISLSMNKIMDKLVGQSERKIMQALDVVKKCAPCVFLIDEVEKSVGGVLAQQTDGGVGARVMKSLLEFMNDNDNGVYVIMTSNDVSALPPEFTRSGRIDAQWYFSIPNATERKSILNVHLKKRKLDLEENLKDYLVKHTDKFTGAEIQQVVKNLVRINFVRTKDFENKSFTLEDIKKAVDEVIPISTSSKEKIAVLEAYCQGRARKVSEDEGKAKKVQKGGIFDIDI